MTWTEWLASPDGEAAAARSEITDLVNAFVAGHDTAVEIFRPEWRAERLSRAGGQQLTTNHHASKQSPGAGLTHEPQPE